MKTIKINVKEKSINSFLEQHSIIKADKERNSPMQHDYSNSYYWMKDEIYLTKDCGLNIGESIKFELTDWTSNSRKELVNTYIYTAESYDDVAVKLVLQDFSVSLKQ